ncbi:MAG: Gfo/Idh/MocA family oxidoreductase [Treponema sp.]|uniref:Gfo/Idh/MocA family protein n=1 Tax=Treponema sp. TaxID=166 RepID=UPI00298ECA2E|nr:Gfo/Idh/MocA family oxidoreductase [Treponema sp.]MBR5933494.1 Gfo/Idh/MocA family oxidoreductase [Treponema sp.]
MDKIKWGILGTANIARWATIPGIRLSTNSELYAVAGRNLDKAKGYAEEYGIKKYYGSYEELLLDNDVQAIYIPLPNNLHKKWVIEALKAKKHVLCEKPLALNAKEAEEMFKTAKDNGVNLMEAYAYLHSPYIKSLKDDIKSGIIGDVDFIDTAFVTQGYKEDIRLYKELGGGALYDLGCYCTTMILSLIDDEVVSAKACAEFTELGVDEITTGFIRFKNGARASFNVGMILGKNTNSRFDRLYVHGTKGCIKSEIEYNQQGSLSYRIVTPEGVTERNVEVPQNYSLEIEQLANCILKGEKPFITSEFSIKNAKVLDALFKEIGY